MATRAEVLNFIGSNYIVGAEMKSGQNTLLKVTIEGVNSKRAQDVFMGVDNSFFVFSPFARLNQVSAENVFKAHEGMRLGLAVVGDVYCVTASTPIRDLDPSEIYVFIELAGKLADELEKKLKLGDVH